MNRVLRVLAIAAPALVLGCWLALNESASSQASWEKPARLTDPSHPDYGRIRALPAGGPVTPDEEAVELSIPLEEAIKLFPELDPARQRPMHAK